MSYTAFSQSLSLTSVDVSNFPTIKAKYYAYNYGYGYPITNLEPSHFTVKENGVSRKVTNIFCPEPGPAVSLSSVLVIDISGSMKGTELNITKTAAIQWINMMPDENSECAVTSFSEINYLNQDSTNNKLVLTSAVANLTSLQGTNYDAAFIEPMAGGILIAKPGKYKKVIVFLTDGYPNFEPQTARIIKEAKENNITIYCVCVNMAAPKCLKDLAKETGGLCFERVKKVEEITGCYSSIYMITQGRDPCTIQWLSHSYCELGKVDVEIKLKTNGSIALTNYERPAQGLAKVEITPNIVKFANITPGVEVDTTITVSAVNSNVYASNVVSSNTAFSVTPTEFLIPSGQSKDLTLSFIPLDRSYQFTEIKVVKDLCDVSINAIGGYRSKKQTEKSLKLTQPNRRDIYVIGTDSLITWEGVFPTDTVTLEYSINKGATWKLLTDKATGLSYI